jgi:hypothetical protein
VKNKKLEFEKEVKKLVGRKIVESRYMTKAECLDLEWYDRTVIITLDDGTTLYPSSDDEGNNSGALHSNRHGGGFPVL